jgi:hypothetical protein
LKVHLTPKEKKMFKKLSEGSGYTMSYLVRTLLYSFHAVREFNITEHQFLEKMESIRASKGLEVFKRRKAHRVEEVIQVDPELLNHTNYLSAQFQRIGNNINQIAVHLNSNNVEGNMVELADIREKLLDALFDLSNNGEKIQALVDKHIIYNNKETEL